MKKGLETYLYTTIGVVAFLAIIVAINLIGSRAKVRMDLTEDKVFTLSDGTRTLLSKLDTPVQIRFYSSLSSTEMPTSLKNYSREVEDLLSEFRQASKGNISIQKLDPQPATEAADSARLDKIRGRPMKLNGEPIYLGLSITMLDQKQLIPFLDPSQRNLLEYEISRAIARVMNPKRATVGIMSPLPVVGFGGSSMLTRPDMQQPGWIFAQQLKRDYNVVTVEMTVEKIPDEVTTLVVIHPKGISETAEYAIDQFLMRGGKLIAYLDPLAFLDQMRQRNPMMGMGGPSSSTFNKLLPAWGLTFDTANVVADIDSIWVQPGASRGEHPALVELAGKRLNDADILTSNAGKLFFPYSGKFGGSPVAGLNMTTLARTSANSQLVETSQSETLTREKFKSTGTEHQLIVRLTGQFKTAFPAGKPKPAAEPKPDEPPKPETPPAESLKQSKDGASVILVGDSDFLQNQAVVAQNEFGQTFVVNGNLSFAQGAVDQFSGDETLIKVRARSTRSRTFEKLKQLQAEAESRFNSNEKIKDIERKLEEVQRRYDELQGKKTGRGLASLLPSQEQQVEMEKAEKLQDQIESELRAEQKKLRAARDSLENKTKWLNIVGMPIVVSVIGIILALMRRKHQAAR